MVMLQIRFDQRALVCIATVLAFFCSIGFGCLAFTFQISRVSPLTVDRHSRAHYSSHSSYGRSLVKNVPWELYASPSSSSGSSVRKRKAKLKSSVPRKLGGAAAAASSHRHNKDAAKRGVPLSLEELAEHVSHEYIHGPGGRLRGFERKRTRFDHTYGPPSSLSDRAKHGEEEEEGEQEESPPKEEHQSVIRNLDRHPALVLNADYQPLSYLPLSIWHWQESVKAVFNGKVTVVDVYPDVVIRAASLRVPLPSVIALTDYVSPQYHHHKPAFTKRNVFLRDEYQCQYCNQVFHTRDLTLDHVVPRCRGGHLNWENAVTSCTGCNGKKGSLGLDEIRSKWGMKLRAPPRIPTQYELAIKASRMLPRQVHPTWEPYLPQTVYNNGSSHKNDNYEASKAGRAKQLELLEQAEIRF